MENRLKPYLIIVSRLPAPYREPLFQKISDSDKIKLLILYECEARKGTAWGLNSTGLEKQFNYQRYFFAKTPDKGLMYVWTAIKWVINILKQENPDLILIHGYYFPISWGTIWWVWKKKRHYALRSDSNVNIDYSIGWKKFVKQFLLTKLVKKSGAILYIGSANKAYWQKYGATDSQLIEAKYAVDDHIFFPAATPRTIDRTVFLFVGRLLPRKNVLLLLEAFKQMQDSWDKMELIIAGTGPQESQVQSFLDQNLNMPVRFLGRVLPADMPQLYQKCDVLVCPYEREPWGLTINEAMSCGLAIIATTNGTCGAAVDLVIDGQNGVGLSNLSSKQLEEAMQYLATDRDRLEMMKKESLKIIAGWKYDSAVSGFIEATERYQRKDKP